MASLLTVPMLPLGFAERLRTVELVVEVEVEVVGLVGEDGAEGAARRREAAVTPVDIFAIGDGGGDGAVGVVWDTLLHGGRVAPAGRSATVAERAPPHGTLVINEGPHGLLQASV